MVGWRGTPRGQRQVLQLSRYFKQMSNAVHFNADKFKAKYVLNIVFN